MHAGTEQLLTLRDGGPVDAGVAQHVAECSGCSERLDELHRTRDALRALPQHPAPAGAWNRINEKLDAPKRSPAGWWLAGAAAAAALAAILAWPVIQPPATTPELATTTEPAAAVTRTAPSVREPEPINRLVMRSQQLEQILQQIEPDAPRVMTIGTADTIAGLQDGIALIDYGLSRDDRLSQAQSERLWRQRVELMNSLVQVRGAQLQQVSNRRR